MKSIAQLILRILAAALFFGAPAFAQTLTTFAGGGSPQALPAPANTVYLANPQGTAADGLGNVYFVDEGAYRLYKRDSVTGVLSIFRQSDFTLAFRGVASDSGANVYVTAGASVLRIDATNGNLVSTFPTGGGNAADVAIDGSTLWVLVGATIGNQGSIAHIDASTGSSLGSITPPADSSVVAVARDGAGNVYISDRLTHRVLKYIGGAGAPVVIAGTGTAGFSGDGGDANVAALNSPAGLAIDALGNVFIADRDNDRVRRIDAITAKISTFAGGGVGGDGGPPASARLGRPQGLAVHGTALLISEAAGRVRRVDAGVITTVAGGVIGRGDGGPATAAELVAPSHITFDAAGNAFFADIGQVRRIDTASGIITTVAGAGREVSSGTDGDPATGVRLQPTGVAVDAAGTLYIGDGGTDTVRKVDTATGTISIYAGGGSTPGDGGPATSAALGGVGDVAFDAAGNLFIAAGTKVRRVDAVTKIITTVAGGGATSNPPDGTLATDADILNPQYVAIDSAGNLLVTTSRRGPAQSYVYRVAAATGLLATVTSRTDASLLSGGFQGLALDPGGNIFVGWTGNLVRRIGTDGRILDFAGTGAAGPTTEGAFANATPIDPNPPVSMGSGCCGNGSLGVAMGLGGHAFIAAPDAKRVFRVTLSGMMASPPTPIAFAGRLPGTTSLPVQVVLTNLGPSAATINSITVPPNFGLSHDCGASVAARASCVANVTFTPPALGTSSGALDITAPVIAQDVSVSGTGANTLVAHYYETILRRSPDAGGDSFWNNERARVQALGANPNETWFAMAQAFYVSSEYATLNRDNTGFVTDLYRTFFNRAPDSGGQAFWVDQLTQGLPREVALAAFMFSTEFSNFTTALFGNTPARAETDMVMDFYRGLLGRLPDNGGFNYWVGRFRTAQCQNAAAVTAEAEAISSAFTANPEYFNRNRTTSQYVGDLYNAFLRRGGDLGGVNFWISQISSGAQSREQVRAQFRNSSEFQARVNAIIAQGCL